MPTAWNRDKLEIAGVRGAPCAFGFNQIGPPARSSRPLPSLERFPHGLTTREVAVVLAPRNEEPDDRAAASALLDLVAEGRATREPLGGDGLWRAAG